MFTQYDDLILQLERLNYDIATEARLVTVGLKDEQAIAPILAQHPQLTSTETLERIRGHRDAAVNGERERLDRLFYEVAELVIHQHIAPLSDRFETFCSQASVTVDDRDIAYHALMPELKQEADAPRRERLAAAQQSIHREANDWLIEMIDQEARLVQSVCGTDVITHYANKKHMDYPAFAQALAPALEHSVELYSRHMGPWAQSVLGDDFHGLNRYHAAFLLSMREFDEYFPKDRAETAFRDTLTALGLSLDGYPNIHLDLEDRAKKHARACCFASHVPNEIHLITKPIGGQYDFETILHEGGHALHHGSTDRTLPYEYRHLARSYALTETYAFLMQNLTMSVAWLTHYLDIPEKTAHRIRYHVILVDLYMFRRYVGKFTSELRFFQEADWTNSRTYAETLTATTGWAYDPVDYLFDMDGGFYSADYLRAWIGEAQLASSVQQQFGERWFLNTDAGDYLKSLWRVGDQPHQEDLLGELGHTPWDTTALEQRFQELDNLD